MSKYQEISNKWLKIRTSAQGGALIDAHLSNGRTVLRAYSASSDLFNILDAGCFPLVPLGNRVADNQFEFAGQHFNLSKNSSESPFYLHGDGWLSEWELEFVNEASILMSLSRTADEHSPYSYLATQTIRLDENSLVIELEVVNKGESLPFGLGLHPYFPRTSDVQLQAFAESFWSLDDRNLPKQESNLKSSDYFNQSNDIQSGLDNCFSKWSGRAIIDYPSEKLRLEIQCSDVFKNYLIYSPEGEDYFCFEPMSHIPNGVNMDDLGGMTVLEEGQSIKGVMRVQVVSL